MSISAVLRKHNLDTDVLVGALEKDILKTVREINPDIVSFSVMTPDQGWLFNLSKEIKKILNVPIVVGGVHASSCPEIIENPSIDYVIVGEGEYIFLQFINAYLEGNKKFEIGGLITKSTPKILYFNTGSLINNLNDLPFEDRDIYYNRYPSLKNTSLKQFISGRGCPFDCSFCFNSFYKTLFKGKGSYVRRKSPEYFISEIEKVKNNYSLKSLFFADDLFAIDVKWLLEFSELFAKKISLPFMCTAMANTVTDDIAKILKNAGCNCVSFGVETGNEDKRRDILNKKISNQDIKRCADALRKYDIKIQTSNIFAFPGETVDDAFQTIRLNSQIKTDYMFSTLMMPLPKTGIDKLAKEKNILSKDYNYSYMPTSFHSKSIFNFQGVEVLENIHKISYLAMKLPKHENFFRWLVKKRWKRVFFILFALSFIYRYKSERKMSMWGALRLFWDFRRSY